MASSDVDLTRNGIFSSFNRVNFKTVLGKIFKDLEYETNNSDDKQKWLVLTGDKQERELKNYYLNQDIYCDRCGELIRKKPWEKVLDENNGLCDRCVIDCGFDRNDDVYKFLFEPPEIHSAIIRIDGDKRRR